MKSKKLFILIFLLLFSVKVYAEDVCSKSGYTVLTINGIWTDEFEASTNKESLKKRLPDTYNNQHLIVDYAYNPTHGAGAGDIVDVAKQGIIDPNSEDFDLVEILNSASAKVKTQKLLLVGHSQGNFYANAFYDKVVNKNGGVPSSSIGVYSVATPDNRVAGGGKYLTSDTDTVITGFVGHIKNILHPNTHIDLKPEDGDGHDFAKVYLEYKSAEIVGDIKASLDKLQTNTTQNADSLCISPQKLSVMHKIGGALLAVADPTLEVLWKGAVGSYNASAYVLDGSRNIGLAIGKSVNGLLASAIGSVSETISTVINPNEVKTESGDVSPAPEVISDITPAPNQEENKTNEILEPTIPPDTNIPDPNTPNTNIPNTPPTDSNNNGSGGGENGGGGGGGGNGGGDSGEDKDKDADIVAPVITIIGDSNLEIVKGAIYTDEGATALDDVDGDLTSAIVKGGTFVDASVLGTYTITYTVKDIANNSTTATRTISVVSPDLIINTDTTLTAGEYNYNNLLVTNNAILSLEGDPNSLSTFKGVKITAKNITIDLGSAISADGKGYTEGPGAPIDSENYAGATYGGKGERNASTPLYGKATEPTELGSGGYLYWRGGGAIRLIVTNTLSNNGVISANGDMTSSGGSIYVTAKNISGTGTFSANGGVLYAAGTVTNSGGGGRIALYYENLSFSGKAEALGGCSQHYNGYSSTCGENGTVGFFDTVNNNLLVNSSWLFQKNDNPFNFNKITFEGGTVTSEKETNITANELVIDKASHFTLVENQIINIPTISIKGTSYLTFSGKENLTANTITIAESSMVNIVPEQTLTLSLANLNIESTASISADWKGSIDGFGVPPSGNGGASYGGVGGGNTIESTYGDEREPTDFGSGGTNNYRGGGAVRLIITDTLSNNGLVTAGGDVTSSGGSIYVTANNVLGSGYFWANGGGSSCTGDCYKPGGGGRIAIHYKVYSFTGQVLADGNSNWVGTSTAGTVKLIDTTIPVPSSEKSITSFNFESLDPKVTGTINDTDHTVNLTVPYGTDIKTLIPTITISEKASVSPNNLLAQDFTNPLTYTVTAEDNSPQSYIVSVTVSPNPNPDPPDSPDDTGDPIISSYTLNGSSGDITANPLMNNVSMIFHSNKKVNWMSIKLENESDARLYKIFQSGSSCVDGTNICTKVWNGVLSGGGLLHNGNYRIKVHIKDVDNREYFEYLGSRIIVNL
ncbi:MAG: immunoglobulin-like domain-containing protein [Candidatus Paceibacterota bacterium]